jgi:hypothetical protein
MSNMYSLSFTFTFMDPDGVKANNQSEYLHDASSSMAAGMFFLDQDRSMPSRTILLLVVGVLHATYKYY